MRAKETKKNILARRAKRVEMLLRESQALYRCISDISPDAIIVASPDLKILATNPQAAILHGFEDSQEMVGMSLLELVVPRERDRALEDTRRILTSGTIKGVEYTLLRKNGTHFIGDLSASAILDERRRPRLIVGVVRDITQRRMAQEALRRERDRIQKYLDIVDVIIMVLDHNQKVSLINAKGCQILGYKEKEIVGKNWFDHFLPSRLRERARAIFKMLIGGEPAVGQYYESAVLTRDGQERIIAWNNVLLKDATGKITGVLSSGDDITERKRVQEELENTLEKLRGLESVINRSPAVVFLWRVAPGWPVEFVSENVKQFGYTPEDFTSGRISWPGITHPEDLCRIEDELRQHAHRGVKEFVQEYRVFAKSGALRWIEGRTIAITNAVGEITHYQGIILDVTERKRAEYERELLNVELRKSNKKLRQLALIDIHTGLFNHRYLEDAIEREFQRARRYGHPLSVAMLDIDYFKSINDVYGHPFGDLVIKQLAKLMERKVRRYDIAVRFGGEEFVVISPATDRAMALVLMQRIFEAIRMYNFGDHKNKIKLKISAGIVSYPEDEIFKGMDLIELAERVLERAKEDGGDRMYCSLDVHEEKTPALLAKEAKNIDVKFLKSKIAKLARQTSQGLVEAVFAFARTIKMKDQYTGEHVEKTVYYATEVAKRLGLHRVQLENIKEAAMLHDLGKIGISEKILLKKTRLTREEFEEIKRHPVIGADIIRPLHFLHDIIPLILYHHERWDGKGYPTGLKREEIPLGARIVAIADVYQALISDRPYRRAYSREKAIEIIKESAGTQFDPAVVGAFLEIAL